MNHAPTDCEGQGSYLLLPEVLSHDQKPTLVYTHQIKQYFTITCLKISLPEYGFVYCLLIIFLLCSTLENTFLCKRSPILFCHLGQRAVFIYSLIFKLYLPECTVALNFYFISASILCNQDISCSLSPLALKTT